MAASSAFRTVLGRLAGTSDAAMPGVLEKLLPRLVSSAASASETDMPELFSVIAYIKKRLTAGPNIQVPFAGLADIVPSARGSSLQALGIFLRIGRERLLFPRDNAALFKLAASLHFKDQSSPLVCELLVMVSCVHLQPGSIKSFSLAFHCRLCQDWYCRAQQARTIPPWQ